MCCGDVKVAGQFSDSRSGLPDELRLLKCDATFAPNYFTFNFKTEPPIGVLLYSSNRSGVGRNSSVGIATRYGMNGPGIKSQWRRDFPHPFRPALGPIKPPIQCEPGLSRG